MMQKEYLELFEIKLVGISVRTSYARESDKMNGNIFSCVKRYFHNNLATQIPNRKKAGTTFCVFTNYETDYQGVYTYFIGEEVLFFEEKVLRDFDKLTIPKQHYVKFTNGPDPMPKVIIDAWNTIWALSKEELQGVRAYQSDFEIYDERALDHQNIILDIYIGIRKE